MSSDGPLVRIEKLMRLAMHNPNEEEARSAAMKCLALMVEHNVTLTLPRAAAASSASIPYDALRDIIRQQHGAAQQQYNYDASWVGWGYDPAKK